MYHYFLFIVRKGKILQLTFIVPSFHISIFRPGLVPPAGYFTTQWGEWGVGVGWGGGGAVPPSLPYRAHHLLYRQVYCHFRDDLSFCLSLLPTLHMMGEGLVGEGDGDGLCVFIYLPI